MLKVILKTAARRALPAWVFLCAAMMMMSAESAVPSSDNRPYVPFTGWKQAETEFFRFIYEDGSRSLAQSLAFNADSIWQNIGKIYGLPPKKLNVLVNAGTNLVNAFSFPGQPVISFFTTPPMSPEFTYRDRWEKVFFTHELTHSANFNFESRSDIPQRLFGSSLGIFNMLFMPGWAAEGITTVMETELSMGGRGRSPYFELYFKAPSVENSFLSFTEIGLEREPPRGQSYVMGYLLFRSIADRFGIGALADIERNRDYLPKYDDAVQLVTGFSCEEIFQDLKKSLVKKYARERTIPEGMTVTPRLVNSFYYKPALIDDNQSIICIRSTAKEDAQAVKYNPSTKEEEVLFGGIFPDNMSLTASADGTAAASLLTARYDTLRRYEGECDIYIWKKETGLRRLTHGKNLFAPALSRDGSRLTACELVDLRYRIVEVNMKTGGLTVLLDNPSYSYMTPSLSDDGSMLTCIAVDGKRGSICTADIRSEGEVRTAATEAIRAESAESGNAGEGGAVRAESAVRSGFSAVSNVRYLVNFEGPVIDVFYPSWSKDGNLLYASNERGRIEVWEYLMETGAPRPVVSDPVGALWAYQADGNLYYASYASTGFSVKVKPSSEYGAVPDFAGPSLPGEVMSFGQLQNDYPDYKPFADKADPADTAAGADKAQAVNKAGADAKKKPELRKRNEKFINHPDMTRDVSAALGKESRFVNYPRPVLWFPFYAFHNNLPGYDDTVSGVGAACVFNGYPLQLGSHINVVAGYASYFPEIGQFGGSLAGEFSLGAGRLIASASRSLGNYTDDGDDSSDTSDDTEYFFEANELFAGVSYPLISRAGYHSMTDISAVSGVTFRVESGLSEQVFTALSGPSYDYALDGSAGLDMLWSFPYDSAGKKMLKITGSAGAVVSYYPFLADSDNDIGQYVFPGAEFDAAVRGGSKTLQLEGALRGRYIAQPSSAPLPSTLSDLYMERLDCQYPGRVIFTAGLVYAGEISLRLYAEKLLSFGTSPASYGWTEIDNGTPLNHVFDSRVFYGLEAEMTAGRIRLAIGIQGASGGEADFIDTIKSYSVIKIDGIRSID